MAGKIVWSPQAQADRRQILAYWLERNKSPVYSRKLQSMFVVQARNLLVLVQSGLGWKGHPTSDPEVRYIFVRDYKLFFEYSEEELHILRIWDARRNPENEPF
ncbi:MAG: type II toxin-antitoxin system RelE/ParE family toxin [Bacteroidetes bacterium]|jgi:toxin YoeB|nr:type II toxin-antitoxin system RelE/ParE family toxin [Bacteroidota bacterium]